MSTTQVAAGRVAAPRVNPPWGLSLPVDTAPTPVDGTCQGWKKPAWQNVLGNPNDGVRDLPDVSLLAADGAWDHAFLSCYSDVANGGTPCVGGPLNWSIVGGTSCASPIMAGVQALVNQQWGGQPQGNPAPVYYALARLEYGQKGNAACDTFATGGPASNCIFHDITIGDNIVDCVGSNNCYVAHGNTNGVGVLSLSDKSYKAAYTAGPGWTSRPASARSTLPIWCSTRSGGPGR